MRAVVQRVTSASVTVDQSVVGQIDTGLLVLLGVTHDDSTAVAATMAAKIAGLRIMRDELSVTDVGGSVLVVSQFTLYADTRKGRRPSWGAAAPGPIAEPIYQAFCTALEDAGLPVQRGIFGADMAVAGVNDGPITLILDS